MAYSKLYSRTNWKNLPSTSTPIDEDNLNNMDEGVDLIDNRMVAMDARMRNIEEMTPQFIIYLDRAETAADNAENSAQNAATSETNAKDSENLSKSWAVGATGKRTGEDTDNSKYYATQSKSWAVGTTGERSGENTNNSWYWSQQAKRSELAAATSEQNAQDSEDAAKASEIASKSSEDAARTYAASASTERTAAEAARNASETAKNIAVAAKESAESSATLSQSYAVGGTGARAGEDTDNAMYWSDEAHNAADEAADNTRDELVNAVQDLVDEAEDAAQNATSEADRAKEMADKAMASTPDGYDDLVTLIWQMRSDLYDLLLNMITIEVMAPEVLIGHTVTCTNGTETKVETVTETQKVTFNFRNYGIYTLSDDFTGKTWTIQAYHYGYYPDNVNTGVIEIICPAAMVGSTVVCTDGTTRYEKIVGNDKRVVFGAPDFGTWTVTNSLTDEVLSYEVTEYTTYHGTFHIATLAVVCDTRYAGDTITATNGTLTYTLTVPSTGVVTFSIPKFATWTVSNSRILNTEIVRITAYTTYSVSFGIIDVNITCDDGAFAGKTLTLTNGSEVIIKTIPSYLNFSMELTRFGTWTVANDLTDDIITLQVDRYGEYDISLLSIAGIGITFTDDLIGETITVTKADGTYTESKVGGSSNYLYFRTGKGKFYITNSLSKARRVVNVVDYQTYEITIRADEYATVGSYVDSYVNK